MDPMLALRIGLPMWSHGQWLTSVYNGVNKPAERLARYAEHFSTVEGNTTFYATPAQATVYDWQAAVPAAFAFTFKFPRQLTHQLQLSHCAQELAAFLEAMTPLVAQTTQWMIQLPKAFGPEALSLLSAFLRRLPEGLPVGVEVRHPAFFAKGDAEKRLNQLLIERGANRIIMDSRPVFAAPADNAAVIDAHQKKPRVPVHAIATATRPTIRFIGHPLLPENDPFFQPWLARLSDWLVAGHRPLLFVHTPDNGAAPQLAHRLYQQLKHHVSQHLSLVLPELSPLGQDAAAGQLGLGL